jgi:hypothetical protein
MRHRDAVTGRFVPKWYADRHPDTTVSETTPTELEEMESEDEAP